MSIRPMREAAVGAVVAVYARHRGRGVFRDCQGRHGASTDVSRVMGKMHGVHE